MTLKVLVQKGEYDGRDLFVEDAAFFGLRFTGRFFRYEERPYWYEYSFPDSFIKLRYSPHANMWFLLDAKDEHGWAMLRQEHEDILYEWLTRKREAEKVNDG